MRFIDPHIHMTARTTDDYERMAAAGVVAVIEPAFWLGQPRTSVGTFVDYLSTIVGWERFRAAQFGIRHYCAIGLNSKEANNEALAEEVLDVLPRYLLKEGVVAAAPSLAAIQPIRLPVGDRYGSNLLTAVEQPYFNGTIFHRVIADFMSCIDSREGDTGFERLG